MPKSVFKEDFQKQISQNIFSSTIMYWELSFSLQRTKTLDTKIDETLAQRKKNKKLISCVCEIGKEFKEKLKQK